MNVRETLEKIGHGIHAELKALNDEIRERISDSDQVAIFPAHLEERTRSKFLQITWEKTGFGHPSGMWSNLVFTSKTTTCVECGGSVVEKLK